MRAWSIKTRVTWVVVTLFCGVIALVAIEHSRVLRADVSTLIAEQQFSNVSRMAGEIDQKFETNTRVLATVARSIAAGELDDPEALERSLEHRPALLELFDDILVVGREGRIVADAPQLSGRRGLDVSDRDYFRELLATRQPVISEPLLGKLRKQPIVQIAVPIVDGDRVVGAVVGVILLNRPNFLGALGDQRIGRSGYYVLLTRGAIPIYVSHPDRSRLFKPRPANGAQAISLALEGIEGSSEDVSSLGVESVYSAKVLRKVNWALIAVVPKAEVMAIVDQQERRLVALGAVAVAILAVLAWAAVGWLLRPLAALQRAIAALRERPAAFHPIAVARQDEVGELTEDFNRLMAERERAESERRASDERLRMVADNLPALVAYLGPDLRFQFANSRFTEWFGITPESMVGRTLGEVFGHAALTEAGADLDAALAGQSVTYECEYPTRQGARVTRSELRPHCDATGTLVGIYCMTTDITADRELQRRLSILAHRDALTGLFNRRSFEERLPEALARNARGDKWLALLYLDLDHFKAVNDTLGHGAGDDVLKAVGERIEGAVRKVDTVARLAGDEFTIILEGLASPADAAAVAAKIIAAIRVPIPTRAGPAEVGASVGVACCRKNVVDAELLIRRADEATYAAKDSGRGCHRLTEVDPSPRLLRSA